MAIVIDGGSYVMHIPSILTPQNNALCSWSLHHGTRAQHPRRAIACRAPRESCGHVTPVRFSHPRIRYSSTKRTQAVIS